MDKCAQDALLYQEIIFATRPEIVIETGSWYGGSSLFLADMCFLAGAGRVLSIDIDPPIHDHPLLTFLKGDSADPETIRKALDWAAGRTGLVILDSAHEKAHVLAELDAYSQFVSDYLIVEDTNINGHPVVPEYGDGPWEAVEEWLARTPYFAYDKLSEPYVTFAPNGYLRRVCVE